MQPDEKKTLSNVRLAMAEEALYDAKTAFRNHRFRNAANRAYYAAFYAMRAVLALDGIDRKHHSGIISEFQRLYIKTGIFDTDLSKRITSVFKIRTHSDYDDVLSISEEDASRQVQDAETVVNAVKAYLKSRSETV